MKKVLFFTVCCALIIGFSGCSSTPDLNAKALSPLFKDLQKRSAKTLDSGGLAVVGVAESKSLELAINKAKTDGRIKLADLLEAKGLSENAADLVRTLAPKTLEHETTNDIFTAYALMELSPEILNPEIKPLSVE